MLILHQLTPIHWALGGAGIALTVFVMLFTTNKRFGISTGFENLCALAIRNPYFQRDEISGSHGWRIPFMVGLVLGGFLSAVWAGGWSPFWDLGRFDTVIGWGPLGKTAWMFGGGLLIGFGTRMAGGCTSGHGIFGNANFEKAFNEVRENLTQAAIPVEVPIGSGDGFRGIVNPPYENPGAVPDALASTRYSSPMRLPVPGPTM